MLTVMIMSDYMDESPAGAEINQGLGYANESCKSGKDNVSRGKNTSNLFLFVY